MFHICGFTCQAEEFVSLLSKLVPLLINFLLHLFMLATLILSLALSYFTTMCLCMLRDSFEKSGIGGESIALSMGI